MTMINDRLLLERIRELKKAATPTSLADAELLEELSSARAKLRVYREASGEPVAWMFHRAQIPRGTWWPWKLSFKQPPEYKGGFRIESVPLYASSQAVPEYPETLPCPVHLVPGLRLGKGCKTETLLIALQRRAEYYAGLDAMTPEERIKYNDNIEAIRQLFPQPESPVTVLCLALERMLKMHELVMNKTNVGASFYDAECIREMNLAPIQARQALTFARSKL